MQQAITDVITFVLSNFTLTFLVIGLIFAWVGIARQPRPLATGIAVEEYFRWYLFWPVGAANLYNFVMHVFFGEMTARFIGWAQSPFQAEVGFASLGFAAIAFLAFPRRDAIQPFTKSRAFGLRIAAVVAPAFFLLGAAAGHVYQMVTAGNFAPGNAGVIFWTDILIPVIGFVLLWLQGRRESGTAVSRSRA